MTTTDLTNGRANRGADEDAAELRALVTDVLRDSTAATAWERLASSGLTLVGVPEASGGSGGDIGDAAAVLEASGASGLPLPLVETTWLAAWLAAACETPAPTAPVTFAIAGPDVGLTPTGDGCRLDGVLRSLPWRHDVTHAHVLVPAAATVAIVPLQGSGDDEERAGLRRGDLLLTGDRPLPCVAVPGDVRAACAELGLRAALARSVQIAGAAGVVRDLTVRYARERVQFGRPLSKNQVIQHYLAQIAADAHAVRVASRHAVSSYAAEGLAAAAAVRAAKAVASTAVDRLTTLAHQVFGAIGTTREHELHRHTMAMWDWRDDAGSEFEHGRVLGRGAVESGDAWDWLVPAKEESR